MAFTLPARTATKPATTSTAPAQVSMFSGVEMIEPRDPMLAPGDYHVRLVSCINAKSQKSLNYSWRATVEIIASSNEDAHPIGSRAFVLYRTTGEGARYDLGKMKAAINAFAKGGDSEEELCARCDAACKGAADAELEGADAYVSVRRGRAVKDKDGQETGDFYREYTWVASE